MRIQVITLFPEMFAAVTQHGITGRAVKQGIVDVVTINPRDFVTSSYQSVDDRPFGGGPGMVMMHQPLQDAIKTARQNASGQSVHVGYLSPQGRKLDQPGLRELVKRDEMILVCGRYEGIDERLIQAEVDEEWSIGDYVLSGGELAAMVMIDGITRLLPNALGHEDSAVEDSFTNGILDYPHYTRPEMIDGMKVPNVLLSGDHQAIARWRQKQALGRTWLRRPDLLEQTELDAEQQDLLDEYIREYESNSN